MFDCFDDIEDKKDINKNNIKIDNCGLNGDTINDVGIFVSRNPSIDINIINTTTINNESRMINERVKYCKVKTVDSFWKY